MLVIWGKISQLQNYIDAITSVDEAFALFK